MNQKSTPWKGQFLSALKILAAATLVSGLLYPACIYGISRLCFPKQASGSLAESEYGTMSELAGQNFQDPAHLWGRPQKQQAVQNSDGTWSLMGIPANSVLSSAEYRAEKERRTEEMRAANPDAQGEVPEELVTWSASGMDPDISFEAAAWQVPRIAKARQVSEDQVLKILNKESRTSVLGGQALVNAVKVNLDLDRLFPEKND